MTCFYYSLTGGDIIEEVVERMTEISAPPPHYVLTHDANPSANLGKWYDRTDGSVHDEPPVTEPPDMS